MASLILLLCASKAVLYTPKPVLNYTFDSNMTLLDYIIPSGTQDLYALLANSSGFMFYVGYANGTQEALNPFYGCFVDLADL